MATGYLWLAGVTVLAWTTSVPVAFLCLCLYLAVFHRKVVSLFFRTFWRDLSAALRFWRVVYFLRSCQWRNKTVVTLFNETAERYADKTMLIFGEKKWTYAEASRFTNQIASFFKSRGLKPGDDVALMMSNCPEMLLLWLGLAKIGVATALINYNLRKTPLAHSVSVVKAKAVIFGADMVPALLEVVDELRKDNRQFFCYGEHEQLSEFPAEQLHKLIPAADDRPPTYKGNIKDRLIYVFTSGTTGLPKAAIIKHYRFLLAGGTARYIVGTRTEDVLYSYLPLYHIAGGVFGISQAVLFGTTAAIAPKFSASRFWSECIKYNCTVTQYIGEVCRYLSMQPPRDEDRKHKIRVMFGNGLRPTLWPTFIKRFGVYDIKEIYGSTEGNANVMNLDKTVGNIGFFPTLPRYWPLVARLLWKRYLIRVHPETGEPLRGPDGLCIMCQPNEPGEFVAVIHDNRPEFAFDGYTDEKSSSKKTYRNVGSHGDVCFATGDILVYDEDGYFYFRDRTGDTFRWKGENVSTTEVENVITKYAVDKQCVVFGVEIPGSEGKAGMAALHFPEMKSAEADYINKLFAQVRSELPPYAMPILIRLTETLEATGTYKLPKMKLVQEGYDITKVSDPMFIFDSSTKKYVNFDEAKYKQLVEGELRL